MVTSVSYWNINTKAQIPARCEPAIPSWPNRHCWWCPRSKVPCQTGPHHGLLLLFLSLSAVLPYSCSCWGSQLVFLPHTPSNCFSPSSISSWMSHSTASHPIFHYKPFPGHDVHIKGQLHNLLTYYRRGQESNSPGYIWDLLFLSITLKIFNKWEQSKLQGKKKSQGSFIKVKKLAFAINL